MFEQTAPLPEHEEAFTNMDSSDIRSPCRLELVVVHVQRPEGQRFIGLHFPLRYGDNVIGKDPAAAVHIDYKYISKQHATLSISDDDFSHKLSNGNSVNGTFLNPQRDGSGDWKRLENWAVLQVYEGFRFKFADVVCVLQRRMDDLESVSKKSSAGGMQELPTQMAEGDEAPVGEASGTGSHHKEEEKDAISDQLMQPTQMADEGFIVPAPPAHAKVSEKSAAAARAKQEELLMPPTQRDADEDFKFVAPKNHVPHVVAEEQQTLRLGGDGGDDEGGDQDEGPEPTLVVAPDSPVKRANQPYSQDFLVDPKKGASPKPVVFQVPAPKKAVQPFAVDEASPTLVLGGEDQKDGGAAVDATPLLDSPQRGGASATAPIPTSAYQSEKKSPRRDMGSPIGTFSGSSGHKGNKMPAFVTPVATFVNEDDLFDPAPAPTTPVAGAAAAALPPKPAKMVIDDDDEDDDLISQLTKQKSLPDGEEKKKSSPEKPKVSSPVKSDGGNAQKKKKSVTFDAETKQQKDDNEPIEEEDDDSTPPPPGYEAAKPVTVEDLKAMTVDELKEYLRRRELPVTGTKKVLVERALKTIVVDEDNDDEDEPKEEAKAPEEEKTKSVTAADLKAMSEDALKEYLRRKELPVNGTKKTLLARAMKTISVEEEGSEGNEGDNADQEDVGKSKATTKKKPAKAKTKQPAKRGRSTKHGDDEDDVEEVKRMEDEEQNEQKQQEEEEDDADSLEALTVAELRRRLKAKGLTSDGTKETLIRRLRGGQKEPESPAVGVLPSPNGAGASGHESHAKKLKRIDDNEQEEGVAVASAAAWYWAAGTNMERWEPYDNVNTGLLEEAFQNGRKRVDLKLPGSRWVDLEGLTQRVKGNPKIKRPVLRSDAPLKSLEREVEDKPMSLRDDHDEDDDKADEKSKTKKGKAPASKRGRKDADEDEKEEEEKPAQKGKRTTTKKEKELEVDDEEGKEPEAPPKKQPAKGKKQAASKKRERKGDDEDEEDEHEVIDDVLPAPSSGKGKGKKVADEGAKAAPPPSRNRSSLGDVPAPSRGRSSLGDAPDTKRKKDAAADKVVVGSSGIKDDAQLKSIDKLKTLGITVEAEKVAGCTHLITAGTIVRTVKVLAAINLGLHIVNITWVQECLKAGHVVDPESFAVKDVAAEKKFGFSLHQSLQRARKHRLFAGVRIYATEHTSPSPAQLKEIVESGGGSVVDVHASGKDKLAADVIVIAHEQDKAFCQKLIARKRYGKPVYTTEFILSGVLRQELDFKSNQMIESTGEEEF